MRFLLTYCHLLVGHGEAASLGLFIFCLLQAQRLICCLSKSLYSPSSSFLSFQFFPPLTNCLHTYLLLKKSKSTLAKSTPRSGGQQFCSCSLNLGSDLRSFWWPLFIELDGSGDFIFLRRVWPVSSARFSSTEQDDQRQTWTCQRLCRTPLVRGDAGRREETEQFRDGRSVITTHL